MSKVCGGGKDADCRPDQLTGPALLPPLLFPRICRQSGRDILRKAFGYPFLVRSGRASAGPDPRQKVRLESPECEFGPEQKSALYQLTAVVTPKMGTNLRARWPYGILPPVAGQSGCPSGTPVLVRQPESCSASMKTFAVPFPAPEALTVAVSVMPKALTVAVSAMPKALTVAVSVMPPALAVAVPVVPPARLPVRDMYLSGRLRLGRLRHLRWRLLRLCLP
jgi:hypothetical protein